MCMYVCMFVYYVSVCMYALCKYVCVYLYMYWNICSGDPIGIRVVYVCMHVCTLCSYLVCMQYVYVCMNGSYLLTDYRLIARLSVFSDVRSPEAGYLKTVMFDDIRINHEHINAAICMNTLCMYVCMYVCIL